MAVENTTVPVAEPIRKPMRFWILWILPEGTCTRMRNSDASGNTEDVQGNSLS